MARWGLIALAWGLTAIAADGFADTKTLARSGSWEAFGGTTTKGRGVCGISAEPGGRYFGLKLFAGDKTFTIQMGTSQWKIEDGRKVPLTLSFDGYAAWRAIGTSSHFEDGDAGLQFAVKRQEVDKFAKEFRDSSTLRINFQDGAFAPWALGLQGTQIVNSAFQNCMRNLP